jgi:hypothetical protein
MSATTPVASTFATPAKAEPAPPARGKRVESAVADRSQQCENESQKLLPGLPNVFDKCFSNQETEGSHFHT